MSFDFSRIAELSTARGKLVELKNSAGRVIWSAEKPEPIVLEVKKSNSNTYASSTEYTDDEFVLLDIYPKSASSVVNVTYGDLTKTLTFSGTNAKQVYFGTFNGVSDEVATPESGTLTIEGGCEGFACGAYQIKNSTTNKGQAAYCNCITSIIEWSGVTKIPDYGLYNCRSIELSELPSGITSIGQYAFYNCSSLAITELPEAITSIPDYAFYQCASLSLTELPSGITSIGQYAFYYCSVLAITKLPEGITSIGDYAFGYISWYGKHETITLPTTLLSIGKGAFCHSSGGQYYTSFREYIFLATTPPTLGSTANSEVFGQFQEGRIDRMVVPLGCGDTYKAAEGYSYYADIIVEAS